jgi:methionine aminotransferase
MSIPPSKLPNVGTTIFTVMSGLAAQHGAINLSQGFPDFDCAPRLRELVTKYFNAGVNQYPPMAGIPKLREAIAEKVSALYGASYDPDTEVTVVPGATYGIFTAVTAFVRPGDEVIVFEPTYDSYVPAIEVNGGTAVPVRLRYPDYSIDWDAVRAAITPKTRMILVNTPNNPTTSDRPLTLSCPSAHLMFRLSSRLAVRLRAPARQRETGGREVRKIRGPRSEPLQA